MTITFFSPAFPFHPPIDELCWEQLRWLLPRLFHRGHRGLILCVGLTRWCMYAVWTPWVYMMWLLWLQFRQKVLWLLWKTDRDIMRQSWCGRRSPNTNAEASSQTTLYSISVVLTSTVCIPHTHAHKVSCMSDCVCFRLCAVVVQTSLFQLTSPRTLWGRCQVTPSMTRGSWLQPSRGQPGDLTTPSPPRSMVSIVLRRLLLPDMGRLKMSTYLENQTSPL